VSPTTGVPTTGVPTTGVPTTGVPTTGIPTTGLLTTEAPSATTSASATTTAPTTVAPPTGTMVPTTGSTGAGSPTSTTAGASGTTGSTDSAGVASDPASASPFDATVVVVVGIVAVAAIVIIVAGLFIVRKRRGLRSSVAEELGSSQSSSESDSLSSEIATSTMRSHMSSSESALAPLTAADLTQYQSLLRDIEITGELGKGAFGTVFRATRQGQACAVKQLASQEASAEKEFMDELNIMLTLESPRVVAVHGVCFVAPKHGGGLGLVMELCPKGSLDSFLERHEDELTAVELTQICQHIAEGLAFLHSKHVLHRDLVGLCVQNLMHGSDFCSVSQACRNVLIAGDGSAKLAE
jgi:Protein tyrosine and serine/threonine kinase